MPNFLSLEEVLLIHRDQIDLYGGTPTVHDTPRGKAKLPLEGPNSTR